ncbi:predicted protein [Sclerotinia sclerotiorum 1980 UF-70]|uniref:Uncharacterized protein n=2 Tax=Sclerotinia sclerotiorum (strain ATCC 18683 / 1980 / Ss-1) TaxID=665079 RepID=A7EL51_SCLS1|nr:predicted protein [Sclerotinia sclerotiorum 1980 UF-70]APA09754.1 hypothetical protein sscle_05g045240 [Sclerotinia sclerotiorum 1980 UF-70]EDO03567.1 predicted protein [Sclerotinia sclerotiorum 1980 UF-70]
MGSGFGLAIEAPATTTRYRTIYDYKKIKSPKATEIGFPTVRGSGYEPGIEQQCDKIPEPREKRIFIVIVHIDHYSLLPPTELVVDESLSKRTYIREKKRNVEAEMRASR